MTTSSRTPAQIDGEIVEYVERRVAITREIARLQRNTSHFGAAEREGRIESLRIEHRGLGDAIDILDVIYRAEPWSRYYLVTNGNGHIHSSTHCSTCFPTTQFAWLTELSGANFETVIEEFGDKVCSICFPQAPVDPRHQAPGRRDREAQAAKAAEKDQRRSAKLEKALLPDGSALRVRVSGFEERVETVVTAERLLVEALFQEYRGRDLRRSVSRISHERLVEIEEESGKAAAILVQALAAKRGTTENEVRRSVVEKVSRKVKAWEKEGHW